MGIIFLNKIELVSRSFMRASQLTLLVDKIESYSYKIDYLSLTVDYLSLTVDYLSLTVDYLKIFVRTIVGDEIYHRDFYTKSTCQA